MPNILYYSTNCEHCRSLLSNLSKNNYENTMYFSVDSRETINEKTYLILSDGSKVLLPVHVTQVPSLLIVDDKTNKNTLIIGNDILGFFEKDTNKTSEEPSSFELNINRSEIVSDNFSYFDTNSDDLMACGDGGLKQMHNYTGLEEIHKIITPPEEYTPNTIGNDEKTYEQLIQERENELNMINNT